MAMAPSKMFDYIIVGAGPAGLTLAGRLSVSLPERSILLIEAGGDPAINPATLTSTGFPLIPGSEQAYSLNHAPNTHLNNRAATVAVGKALGGSAVINYGAWTRGPKADYDLWAKIVGDEEWSYDAMLPYFRMSENDRGEDWRDETQHGYDGAIVATPIKNTRKYPLRQAVSQAWEEAGFPYSGDPDDGDPNGVTEGVEAWINGKRQLPHKILDLSQVTIWENTKVARVTFDTNTTPPTATGVELLNSKHVKANIEVIISAGTYHTPQILMLSGIGPPATLKEHDIPVAHANNHVGAHLKDHLAIGIAWELTQAAFEAGSAIGHPEFMKHEEYLWGWPMDFLTFQAMPQSFMPTLSKLNETAEDEELVCRPDATHIESIVLYMIHPKFTGVDLPMDGRYITSTDIMLTPTSQGTVSIGSANPGDPPLVDGNWNATESDRFILREGMRRTAEVLTRTEAGRTFVKREIAPEGLVPTSKVDVSDEELDKRIVALGLGLDHPMGTCRMATTGAEDERTGGVVDSHCRVFGVKDLRVVDASVLPVPMAAHLQACVYALAERVSSIIINEQREGQGPR